MISPDRTWRLSRHQANHQAANLVTVARGFQGFLRFELEKALNKALTGAPVILFEGPTSVVVSSRALGLDGKSAEWQVDALDVPGSYALTVTVQTLTGDSIPFTGALEVV